MRMRMHMHCCLARKRTCWQQRAVWRYAERAHHLRIRLHLHKVRLLVCCCCRRLGCAPLLWLLLLCLLLLLLLVHHLLLPQHLLRHQLLLLLQLLLMQVLLLLVLKMVPLLAGRAAALLCCCTVRCCIQHAVWPCRQRDKHVSRVRLPLQQACSNTRQHTCTPIAPHQRHPHNAPQQ